MSNSNKAILNSLLNTFAAAREKRSDVTIGTNNSLSYTDPKTNKERLVEQYLAPTITDVSTYRGWPGVNNSFFNAWAPGGLWGGYFPENAGLMANPNPSTGDMMLQTVANPLAAGMVGHTVARGIHGAKNLGSLYRAGLLSPNPITTYRNLNQPLWQTIAANPAAAAQALNIGAGTQLFTNPGVAHNSGMFGSLLRSIPGLGPVMGLADSVPMAASRRPSGEIPATFTGKNGKPVTPESIIERPKLNPDGTPMLKRDGTPEMERISIPRDVTPGGQTLARASLAHTPATRTQIPASPGYIDDPVLRSATQGGTLADDLSFANRISRDAPRNVQVVQPPKFRNLFGSGSYAFDPRASTFKGINAANRSRLLTLLLTGTPTAAQVFTEQFENPDREGRPFVQPTSSNPNSPEGTAMNVARLKQQLLDKANN